MQGQHMERWAAVARLSLVLLFAFSLLKCHQVLFTAPAGTTVSAIANPEFIPANGGVSVISGLLILPSGAPVADGTQVQFFTNLGRMEPEIARTNDGVARSNLVSDSRSGTALVTVISGGGTVGGGGGSSTTQASSTTTTSFVSVGALAASQLANSATVSVRIGSVLPARIVLTAFPPALSDKRATLITANVFDSNGNPVANVPIIFSVSVKTAGLPLTEFMDSQGTPTFTDNNGQAFDLMRTRWDSDAPEKTVSVKAEAPTNLSQSIDVVINPGLGPSTTTTTTLSSPKVVSLAADQTTVDAVRDTIVTATVTSAGSPVPSVSITFAVAFLAGTAPLNEVMQSSNATSGVPQTTDSAGKAEDVVHSNDPTGANTRTVKVTGKLSSGETGTINLTVKVP